MLLQKDKNPVTCYVQTKGVTPSVWSACDYVLQFEFKIAQKAGSIDTAAAFLCKQELKVLKKLRLINHEDIQKTPIEAITISVDVSDEEQFIFSHGKNENETGERSFEKMKEKSRKNAAKMVANGEPATSKIGIKEVPKIEGNST